MKAITKTWLRMQHKRARTHKPFRVWCRNEGKFLVESVLNISELGPNQAVYKLTGVPMGDGAELAHHALMEAQKARKGRALIKAAATRAKRRAKAKK